ncbi:GIY-YIG nuclease family protein [Pseudomonas syringae]|uniref:GIY-YIG nuclease family protein n=1 Tax=Pseudomonas syringae TaxID=317 RepID=UPI0009B177C9|nr:GIY-YIG nuclease family protein [Pseudomonas syringae]
MPVYFIGQVLSNNCNHIKIGRASDISRWRGQLQTCSPHPLEIIGWIHSDNDAVLERQFHLDFATRGRAAAPSRPFERSAS